MDKDNADKPAKKPSKTDSALEQAAERLPVKNYSDYEITIETKSHYEDALFSDEQELEQSIDTDSGQQAEQSRQQKTTGASPAQDATDNVPVRDYSDYEITIESKTHYEDALFPDEASIEHDSDDAGKQPDTVAPPSTQPTNPQPANTEPTVTVDINVEDFLTAKTKAGHFSLATERSSDDIDTHLAATEAGVNGSLASDDIDYEDDGEPEPEPVVEPVESKPVTEPVEQPAPKTLQEKLLRKARQLQTKAIDQLHHSKEQFDEYSGRSLPERTLPLEFIFTSLKTKKDVELVSSYDIRKLFETKRPLIRTLTKADEDLSALAKCKVLHSSRLKLLDTYCEPLAEKILSVIAMFRRKPSAPKEAEKRLEIALHSQNVLRHLITGYKQVYADIYEANNMLYGPQRNTANQTAFRLLELLLVEQLLSTTLHSPLPSGSAKTVNKLFYALSLYEPEQLTAQQPSLFLPKSITIKTLFFYYQLYLALDTHSISSSQHDLLAAYLHQHIGLLKCIDDPASAPKPVWETHHDHAGPAKLVQPAEREQQSDWPAIYIQCHRLFNQIKKDYAECLDLIGNKKPVHSCDAFASIDIRETLTLLCALNQSVDLLERHVEIPSYTLFQSLKQTAYSGIDDCIAYLDYANARSRMNRPQGEPKPELPPKPTASHCLWECAMEDEQAIYLQANEPRAAIRLDIGLPLLLIRSLENDGEDNSEPLQIVRISRLERPQLGKVHIMAEKLGDKVAVFKDQTGNSAGLLAVNRDQHYLLSSLKEHVWTGKTFAATFPDNSQATFCIEALQSVSQELQVLTLA